ncbi:MAG: hypothetical protein IJV83_00485 [Clostridia bacterium]|nr:hypothetical protein [Clostridia bacterium]
MAKKKNSKRTSSQTRTLRGCAFFALTIAAAIFLFSGLVAWLDISIVSSVMGIIGLIGQVCLVIGIAFPAYDFTCGKTVGWRGVYWIALLVYLAGCVFGVLPKF